MKSTIKILIVLLLCFTLIVPGAIAAERDTKLITMNLVNQDPDPAISGDVVEIRVGIENRGGSSYEDVVLEFIPEYPFDLIAGESAAEYVGTIGAYQTDEDMKIVKCLVRINRDATEGQYEMEIREYVKGQEDEVSIEHNVFIDVKSRESAEVIYIDQVELIPGKITPLKFTINNVGSSPLRDLTFSWENEDGIILPVGSDDTKFIKYIEIGESADVVYNVIASGNAEPDLYKLSLSLVYDDQITNEEKEVKTYAGVYVGGETDFDITFSGSAKGETSFSVSNIGNVPANSVTVSIPEQRGWKVSGSESVIIGNLNKGDYTIAGFKLQQRTPPSADAESTEQGRDWQRQQREGRVSRDGQELTDEERAARFANRGQATTVKVEVKYTDTRGNRLVVTKDVKIDPASLRSGTGSNGARGGQHGSQEIDYTKCPIFYCQ